MSNEKIICPAVRFYPDTGDLSEDGAVIMGLTYESCEETFMSICHDGIDAVNEGFMTSKGRFVNPIEAMGIALKANQIEEVEILGKEVANLASVGGEKLVEPKEKELEKLISSYTSRKLYPEDINPCLKRK